MNHRFILEGEVSGRTSPRQGLWLCNYAGALDYRWGMRIVVLDDYESVAASTADWSGLDVRFEQSRLQGDALVAALADADAVVLMRERTPITAELLSDLPMLRLIVTTGPRNAAIDLGACRTRGIQVCGTRPSGVSAAELTWALLLSAARRIPAAVANVRAGEWSSPLGQDLAGATLGVIGLGRLGSIVSGYGLAFGMNVIAWSPNLTAERCQEVGVSLVHKSELLAQSDFVTIHLVLSPTTTGLIGQPEFALMKSTAWLVNTSRGPIVDAAALVHACTGGQIAGAALDVFDQEPLDAADPLRSLENVIPTPHIGYATRNAFGFWYSDVVADLRSFIAGQPIRLLA